MRTIRIGAWLAPLALCASLLACGDLRAQSITIDSEYSKKVVAAAPGQLANSGTFGERVSPSTGATEFVTFDVDLPGNNMLPVRFGRRLPIESRYVPSELGGLGNWDIEIPYISTFTSKAVGWRVSSSTAPEAYRRCSTTVLPHVEGVIFSPKDVSSGIVLHMPGEADEQLLLKNSAVPDPTDGLEYKWNTASLGKVACLSSLSSGNPYPGEGFLLVRPDGTRYYFDYAVERDAETLRKGPRRAQGYSMPRKKIFFLATKITDRFGNDVNFSYTNGKLTSVASSDGRQISIVYGTDTTTVSAGDKTWQYRFVNRFLDTVVNPDGTVWTYAPFGTYNPIEDPDFDLLGLSYFDPGQQCLSERINYRVSGDTPFRVAAPSGAVADFVFSGTRFYRANTPYTCYVDFFDHDVRVGSYTTYITTQVPDMTSVWAYLDENPGSTYAEAMANAEALDQQTPINDDMYQTVSGYAHVGVQHYFDVFSLTKQTVSGAGIAPLTTTIEYLNEAYGFCGVYDSQTGLPAGPTCDRPACPDAGCVDGVGRWVETTLPSGRKLRKRFGVIFGKNEGLLLNDAVVDSGMISAGTAYTYLSAEAAAVQGLNVSRGWPLQQDAMADKHFPMVGRQLDQDGVRFSWLVDQCNGGYCLDSFLRPTREVRSSSLGYTRTDSTRYYDSLNHWVLGQIASSTNENTGLVESSRTFRDDYALPVATSNFGALVETRDYNSDGTLRLVEDGNGASTSTADWYRGIPRSITFPDQTLATAAVSNEGLVTAVTDERLAKRCFEYDLAGRLKSTLHPSEAIASSRATAVCDSSAWNPESSVLERVNVAEYGIAPGHWRLTSTRGNRTSIVYLDALYRPLVEESFDAADRNGTTSWRAKRYDLDGHVSFESYPVGAGVASTAGWGGALAGVTTAYDALGRPRTVQAASELGTLTTSIRYLSGFLREVTDPRGSVTTQSFQVFDTPSEERPVLIDAPEGQRTTITRDVFGKPTRIERGSRN